MDYLKIIPQPNWTINHNLYEGIENLPGIHREKTIVEFHPQFDGINWYGIDMDRKLSFIHPLFYKNDYKSRKIKQVTPYQHLDGIWYWQIEYLPELKIYPWWANYILSLFTLYIIFLIYAI